MEAEIGVSYSHKPENVRMACGPQELGGQLWHRFPPPQSPQKEPALLTPGFQTSGLQNFVVVKAAQSCPTLYDPTWENTFLLRHPIGGTLIQQPEGSNTLYLYVCLFFPIYFCVFFFRSFTPCLFSTPGFCLFSVAFLLPNVLFLSKRLYLMLPLLSWGPPTHPLSVCCLTIP